MAAFQSSSNQVNLTLRFLFHNKCVRPTKPNQIIYHESSQINEQRPPPSTQTCCLTSSSGDWKQKHNQNADKASGLVIKFLKFIWRLLSLLIVDPCCYF